MDEPIVTAAPPPPRVKNLAQQETDFTSEGSPPPGAVGPVASLPSVDVASDHKREKRAGEKSARAAAPGAPEAQGRRHDARAAHVARQR